MNELATRLRLLRNATGETQTEVGEAVGAGQRNVWTWENGRAKPDWETVVRLADHFDVSVDYLLGRTDDPSPPRQMTKPTIVPLARWLRERIVERRVSLRAVAETARIPMAVLLGIQEGTATEVSPVHIRQLASFFNVPEEVVRGLVPSPNPPEQEHDKVTGVAASVTGDLTEAERQMVEEIIRRHRQQRRDAGDRGEGGQ